MKREHPGVRWTRIAWIALAASAVTGYAAVVLPNDQAKRSVEAHAQALYDQANRDRRVLADARRMERARARVERDVAALTADDSSGKTAVAALRLLQAEGKRHRVAVSSLVPDESDGASGRGTEDVAVSLRGAYRDVIAAIADVSRARVVAEVLDADLSRAADGGAAVDASVRLRLYHGIASLAEENDRAATIAP